ncbi:hypothetical protein ACP4OV_020488 [Aristida adscensionis]
MAIGKMATRLIMAAAFCVVLLSSLGTAAAAGKTGRITVYWGQTANEGSLRKACESKLYSTVIISFLTRFGGGGGYKLDLAGHSWAAVGPDIKYCQSKDVLVLLSIGGGIGKYSLASKADAKAVADHLWDFYLGGRSKSRPFGNAVLDGIDFDIELGSTKHYDDLARYLKQRSRKGRKVWLTAAPQCPFPDRMLGEALRTGLFDRVHVQFYNNPVCSYREKNVAAFTKAWKRWASSLPRSSVYLGLPASAKAAGSGYVSPAALKSRVLPIVQRSRNYGGIMLWSRYWDLQTGYSKAVKRAV